MDGKSGNPPPYSGYPPQQDPPHQHPAYQYPPPQPPVVVVPGEVIHQTNIVRPVVVGTPVGPKPSHMTCRSCRAEIVTRVEYKSTTKTHLMALLLCVLGCWCCVCIPYCTDSCQNADHYCPNCNSYIGAYSS
ncbi:lipopolysaccharide-induced tumor necrosis factor-alpha factor homolog [Hyposmocoma kahamanoa]|uniref:lipopolysaccharide-induced tumor necrosis factor-alpha factor homolog n=1 Tax=Hyposmocoma kahamanoa TaxID=1477025 RepID=UPI000E6DA2C8|nr:lipopolysaccharide-induced tumor necrosis factor-alpha factor homolog [Hyposmocoma kahamanoa]